MGNFETGDKVRVTNLDNVKFGDMYFNEGDVTTVKHAGEFLGVSVVFVNATKNAERLKSEGIDSGSLVFMPHEISSLAKLKEVN